jgi:CubicO group peptidase (beta-lactamase class C family)
MRNWRLPAGLVVTLLAQGMDAPVLHAQAADSLTGAITIALAEEGLVGTTWALIIGDRTTVGAAGLNDARRQLPMSPHDRVQIGSVTKTLIATGILRLVTEGRVALDAPVTDYLPDIPFESRWEGSAPLLVRHLSTTPAASMTPACGRCSASGPTRTLHYARD